MKEVIGLLLKNIKRGITVWTFISSPVFAATINVTMDFKPSAFNSELNQFVNTTKKGAFCEFQALACDSASKFTVDFPIASFRYFYIKAGVSGRMGAFLKIPGNAKTISVINTKTQQRGQLSFRPSGLAVRYALPKRFKDMLGADDRPEITVLMALHKIWSGTGWNYPPAECRSYGSTSFFVEPTERSFWLYPPGSPGCSKTPAYDISSLIMDEFGLMYEMTAPDPYALGNGVYTGSVDYSIGPGKDFDFGDNASPTDTNLRINFTLTVQHELKVTLPSESNRVLLEPPNGWQVWMQQGSPPASLKRDIPFSVASSGNFSLRLECQYRVGVNCGIRNKNNTTTVPVEMAVTIQGTKEKTSGKNTEHWPLTNALQGPVFSSRFTSAARQSVFYFEVKKASVDQMIKRAGDQYKGIITVIFDAGSL